MMASKTLFLSSEALGTFTINNFGDHQEVLHIQKIDEKGAAFKAGLRLHHCITKLNNSHCKNLSKEKIEEFLSPEEGKFIRICVKEKEQVIQSTETTKVDRTTSNEESKQGHSSQTISSLSHKKPAFAYGQASSSFETSKPLSGLQNSGPVLFSNPSLSSDSHTAGALTSSPSQKNQLLETKNLCNTISSLQSTPSIAQTMPFLSSNLNVSETTSQQVSKPTTQHSGKNCKQYFELLDLLGLCQQFPQKITTKDALVIRQETLISSKYTEKVKLLPYLVLQNIMNSDYRSRKCQLKSDTDSNSEDDDDDNHTSIHPMDCFLALIHCCNNFIRQDIFAKVFGCRLALPLVLPNPADGTLSFLLWALRYIIPTWKVKNPAESGKWLPRECAIVEYDLPIVAFVRLGESNSYSKSSILNEVIGETGHNSFFHWNCEGGMSERKLVDGLIEFCCFLPSGKETDCHSDAVLFANLRGDIRHHPKQVSFIQKVSFITFVLATLEDINDDTLNILQGFSASPGGMVLLMSARGKHPAVKSIATEEKCSKIVLQSTNMAGIKDKIRKKITKKLSIANADDFTSLSKCATVAKDLEMIVDENNADCIKGKNLAIAIMKDITTITKAGKLPKQEIVPLQGSHLWQKWAEHDKEHRRHLQRGKKSIPVYNDEIEKKKCNIREKQLAIAQHLSSPMSTFLKAIQSTTGDTRNYFLRWLKWHLDNYSRKILPKLNNEYFELKEKLKEYKSKGDKTSIGKISKELEDKNQDLIGASFGLEHFFREVSQIYEARMDPDLQRVPLHLKQEVYNLPVTMIEIMEYGYPLELMDGDASHVPKTWMLAIFETLEAHYKNKTMCVLSVLGIQSTGKSTLLNTMFGLKFSVSAGRCTRGAFMQLLPLTSAFEKKTGCSYVLVVDTEGLRAPELQTALGLPKHDNELATFVIGLADVTIINIFGEAPGDMDDLLQTAIHAFIRMKNIDLQPSCLLVHQNVTDALAIFKGKQGREKFQEKLEFMTSCAAKIEHCGGKYRSFSDVIKFNDKQDVFPFPVLWEGSPPMAPVHPDYSDSCVNLICALTRIITERKCYSTINHIKLRTGELWEAVLIEKFVFSFKNTMEVVVYNELDSEFAQWKWKLQQATYEIVLKANNVITNCANIDSLNTVLPEWLTKAKTELRRVFDEQKDELEKFFNKDKQRLEILAQWKETSIIRLSELWKDCEANIKSTCETGSSIRKGQFVVEEIESSYQAKFQDHLRTKVLESKKRGRKLSTIEIENMFSSMWDEWIKTVRSKNPKGQFASDDEIENSVIDCLNSILSGDDQLALKKLSYSPITTMGHSLDFPVNKNEHLTSTRFIVRKLFVGISENDYEAAKLQNNVFLKQTRTNLIKVTNFQGFSVAIMYDLLIKLYNSIKSFNDTNKKGFKFTPEYVVDISLTVGGHAVRHYKKLMVTFRRNNDPLGSLIENRSMYLNTFRSEYDEIAQETAAAENFCYLIVESIKRILVNEITLEIVKVMKAKEEKLFEQVEFKIKLLTELAKLVDNLNKGEPCMYTRAQIFQLYTDYLKDIRSSFKWWSKYFVMNFCQKTTNGKSNFTVIVKDKLENLLKNVSLEVNNLNQSGNLAEWLKKFHYKFLEKLKLDLSVLQRNVGSFKVTSIDFFASQVMEGFEKAKQGFMQQLEGSDKVFSEMMDSNNPPDKILYDTIIGCNEQCPFCGEQCDLSSPNHIHETPHRVQVHRPDCLGRYKWIKSHELSFVICNTSICEDATFINADTNNKHVPYKEYKSIYKNWYIKPEKTVEPPYWKWFVATFINEIVEWCDAVPTPVPTGWNQKDPLKAISTLTATYKMNVNN